MLFLLLSKRQRVVGTENIIRICSKRRVSMRRTMPMDELILEDPVGNEHRRLRDLHCSNIPEPPPENKEIVDSRLLKRLRRYLY